jgi:hypothetical protein
VTNIRSVQAFGICPDRTKIHCRQIIGRQILSFRVRPKLRICSAHTEMPHPDRTESYQLVQNEHPVVKHGSELNTRSKLETVLLNSMRWTAGILHAGMFLLHLALLVLYRFHPEHHIHISLEKQRFASTFVTIMLQAISIVSFFYSHHTYKLKCDPRISHGQRSWSSRLNNSSFDEIYTARQPLPIYMIAT